MESRIKIFVDRCLVVRPVAAIRLCHATDRRAIISHLLLVLSDQAMAVLTSDDAKPTVVIPLAVAFPLVTMRNRIVDSHGLAAY